MPSAPNSSGGSRTAASFIPNPRSEKASTQKNRIGLSRNGSPRNVGVT